MLTGAAVKKLLLAAAAAAAGGYAVIPPQYLWAYGIHKRWQMEPFQVEGSDGAKLSSEDCEGRPVLLVVWAAWCPYMPQNLREIERVKSRYSSTDACIVPVSNDSEKEKAWQFVRSQDLLGPYYWSYYGLSNMYWGHGTPHSFVFDRSGRLVLSEDTVEGGYNGVMTAMDAVVHDGESIASPSPTSPGHAPKPLPEDVEANEVAEQARQLYQSGDFDGVETLAKEWRTQRARTSMDVWKEWTLYKQIVIDSDDKNAGDGDFEARIKYFENWSSARPASVVARMALAREWFQYAFRAGDDGPLSRERLEKSRLYLEQAEALPDKTPALYYTMIGLALAQDWPEAKRDELFRKAIAFEPDYLPYYLNYENRFEPQWGASYDDLRAFVERAADGRGDARGDELYARLVWKASEDLSWYSFNPFRHGFAWPRVLSGYRAVIARWPNAASWRGQCARLAVLAGDRAVAREMFASEGVRYSSSGWRDHAAFARDRRWALRGPSLWARLLSLIGLGGLA